MTTKVEAPPIRAGDCVAATVGMMRLRDEALAAGNREVAKFAQGYAEQYYALAFQIADGEIPYSFVDRELFDGRQFLR